MGLLAPVVALAAVGLAALALERARRRVLVAVGILRRDRTSELSGAVEAARSATGSLARSVELRLPR